ncbi:MAG TPA: hypothetical protein VE689_05475 [Candidatus Udaeobacter sp.]|nr:hypothetical protein [Candidatus Udaeobacter sp.]
MRISEVSQTIAGQTGSLLQPDPLVPAQFFEIFRRQKVSVPEKKLMFAIMEDAIICFQKYASVRNHREMRCFREAESWIFNKDSDWWFSFENICAHLGLNPNYIRRGLTPAKKTRVIFSRDDDLYAKKSRARSKRKYRDIA